VYEPGRDSVLHLSYCLYGPPHAMAKWIGEKEQYVAPDLGLADCVPQLLTTQTLETVIGLKERYEPADAQRLLKKQASAAEYRELADLDGGYSPEAMLELLRWRCRYVIERGSTLNNPKIPPSFFDGWERINRNHAARLRELVVEVLRST
jgi:hypothetical protein